MERSLTGRQIVFMRHANAWSMKLAELGSKPGTGELLIETQDMLQAYVPIFFTAYTTDVD